MQANMVGTRIKACLPASHGVRVSVAELAVGGGVGTGSPVALLLAARPALQHLGFSMRANGITVEEVCIFLAAYVAEHLWRMVLSCS